MSHDTVSGDPITVEPAHWRPLTRVAFRFCVVYFGIFCL